MPYIEKSGFTSCKTLVKSIVADLTENGFTKMTYGDEYIGEDPDYYVLTATDKVNSLAGTQDWCIWFDARGGDSENDELECAVLTPAQIVVTEPEPPADSTPNVLEPAKLTATDTALSIFGDYKIRNIDSSAVLTPSSSQQKPVYYDPSSVPEKQSFSLEGEYVGILGSHIFKSTGIVDTNEENNLSIYDLPSNTLSTRYSYNDPSFYKFFDRSEHPNSIAYPMSYTLLITDRGIALNIWEQASDDSQNTQNSSRGSRFAWVVVQRPVQKDTGTVYTDGNAPVFCLYSCGRKQTDVQPLYLQNTPDKTIPIKNLNTGADGILYYLQPYKKLNLVTWASPIRRFTVREKTVDKPTISVPATIATVDNNAVLNDSQQVAIAEDGRYILTFPNKWNTQTALYPVDTDLIATTSADVISQNAEVSFKPYGESTDRTYKALQANGVNNTGMRILFMKEGPGITLSE